MAKPILVRRRVAIALLIALPAVAGARLTLDTTGTEGPSVEAEHQDRCSLTHDHRVCAIILKSPGSPATSALLLPLASPPLELSPPANDRAPSTDAPLIRLPRGPPVAS